MTIDNEERLKEKIDFFMKEKVCVHVQLKDKTFVNGFIDKQLKEGIYWFIEKKIGEMYLFLKDIYEVEEFRKEQR